MSSVNDRFNNAIQAKDWALCRELLDAPGIDMSLCLYGFALFNKEMMGLAIAKDPSCVGSAIVMAHFTRNDSAFVALLELLPGPQKAIQEFLKIASSLVRK